MELYRLLYGFVSTIVWIWFEYCMDLYRILSGFVSTYIWNAYVIVYLIGVIYTLFIKKKAETHLCRVPGQGHTANEQLFAVCQAVTVHGKRHFQWGSEHCILFCRGPRKALGKVFAVCPKCSTRQTSSLSAVVCRALFAVCYTRQTLCRVETCLCRVPLAHGKHAQSRSVSRIGVCSVANMALCFAGATSDVATCSLHTHPMIYLLIGRCRRAILRSCGPRAP